MATIVDYITNASRSADYANLVEAATFADLVTALKGDNLTLLAPPNAKLGAMEVPPLNRWNKMLTSDLLLNHVTVNNVAYVPVEVTEASLNMENLTIDDQKVFITDKVPKVALSMTYVTAPGDVGNSGQYVIYDISGVLVPESQTTKAPSGGDTLFDGVAARLGTTLAAYARDDLVGDKDTNFNFYNATKYLRDLDMTYSADLAYTVFLPTALAFTELTTEVADKKGLTQYLDDGGLEDALKAHITTGAPAVSATTYTSLSSTDIVVDLTTGSEKVTIAGGDATIKNLAPVAFQNGNVHEIMKVLQFPRLTTVEATIATASVSTLESLVIEYELVDTLNSFNRSTIFAPNDAALLNLATYAKWNTIDITKEVMQKVLKHHVVADARVYSTALPDSGTLPVTPADGEAITLEDLGTVVAADVLCTNGNIHIISNALVPPSITTLPTYVTVAEIASKVASTSKLYEYVGLFADIVDLLSTVESGKSYTVFAPTNDAFAALSVDDLAYLTENDNAKLKEVLLYHVVEAGAVAGALEATQDFATALGGMDKLTVVKDNDGAVTVNTDSKVTTADVKAFNGVVHVIDMVLVPSTVMLPSANGNDSSASSMTVSAIAMAVASAFAMV